MSYAAVAAKGPKQSPEEVSHWRTAFSAYCEDLSTDSLDRRKFNQLFNASPSELHHTFHTASSGPLQARNMPTFKNLRRNTFSAASKRAPPPPQILHDDSSTASLIDVDSPHISSVPSDYSGETSTQQERQEGEAEEAERAAKETFDEVSRETGKEYEKTKQTTQEKGKEAKSKAREIGHDVEVKAKEAGQKAKEVGHDASKKAKEVGRDVNQKAKEVGRDVNQKANEAASEISENRDNPVVIGNAVIIGLGGLALGIGWWRKYKAGELDWQVGGLWAGAIGLFALGDYYLSQYLFRNKYPRK